MSTAPGHLRLRPEQRRVGAPAERIAALREEHALLHLQHRPQGRMQAAFEGLTPSGEPSHHGLSDPGAFRRPAARPRSDHRGPAGPILSERVPRPHHRSHNWWSLRPDSPAHARARRQVVQEALKRAREYADALGSHLTALLEIADLGAENAAPSHPCPAHPAAPAAVPHTAERNPKRPPSSTSNSNGRPSTPR